MRRVSLHAHTLDQMYGDIRKTGRATGTVERARELVGALRARVRAVERAVRRARRPRVFCMEWVDPVFTTGHWVPEMVRLAGGREGLALAGQASRRIAWEAVVRYAPEKLILMPCGLPMDRAVRDARELRRRPGWESLPAVRAGEVYVADGPSYFNGAGPRLVDGIEILAEILHPDRVRARHRGRGYRRLRNS